MSRPQTGRMTTGLHSAAGDFILHLRFAHPPPHTIVLVKRNPISDPLQAFLFGF